MLLKNIASHANAFANPLFSHACEITKETAARASATAYVALTGRAAEGETQHSLLADDSLRWRVAMA